MIVSCSKFCLDKHQNRLGLLNLIWVQCGMDAARSELIGFCDCMWRLVKWSVLRPQEEIMWIKPPCTPSWSSFQLHSSHSPLHLSRHSVPTNFGLCCPWAHQAYWHCAEGIKQHTGRREVWTQSSLSPVDFFQWSHYMRLHSYWYTQCWDRTTACCT